MESRFNFVPLFALAIILGTLISKSAPRAISHGVSKKVDDEVLKHSLRCYWKCNLVQMRKMQGHSVC